MKKNVPLASLLERGPKRADNMEGGVSMDEFRYAVNHFVKNYVY